MSIKDLLSKLLPSGFSVNETSGAGIQFELSLGNLHIGTLIYKNNEWVYCYSEAFKNQDSIKPLTQFPNKKTKYKSQILWPFFASRIPSENQNNVEAYLKSHPEKKGNLADLLAEFGKTSVNNPFKLSVH